MIRKLFTAALILTLMSTLHACREEVAEQNPFFAPWETPFGVPPFDKIKSHHYQPAIEAGIVQHRAQIDSIAHSPEIPTFSNVIEALDNSGELLNTAYTIFSLIKNADSDDELQRTAAEMASVVTAHNNSIYLNDDLFRKVRAVYDERARLGLDPDQLRLTEKTYSKFVREGALLDAEQKAQLRTINERLSELSVQFGKNLLAESKDFILTLSSGEGLSGLPVNVRQAAQEEADSRGLKGKWVFTLSKPSWIPFLTYSTSDSLREILYKAYLERGNHPGEHDNRPVAAEITRLRLRKAQLLGYPTYADFVLDNVMAKTPDKVYSFLDKIWTPALKLATEELEQMRQLKRAETGIEEFHSWDWWYYAEKLRMQKYALDEEMIRPYLSLDYVTQGIFQLANRLWGTTFRPVALPQYNLECTAYEVLDTDDTHLGILYFDFFPRPGKQNGAWCGSFRRPHYRDGKRVAPVVTIVCNFPPPLAGQSPLLGLDDTETLFHEFGHALHTLFSQVRYRGIGGVERDFVELPSQIMENWAFDPQMLKMYAKHYQMHTDMPDDLVQKIRRSRYFNQGFVTTELAAAALSDMDIHSIETEAELDINAFEFDALYTRRGLLPEIEPRYRYPYFSHIFNGGYAAGYYSYLWAEVLDKDAFEAFAETGDIFNRAVARSFREQILEKGGSADGMTLYRNFRGADPGINPLLWGRGLAERPPVPFDETTIFTPPTPAQEEEPAAIIQKDPATGLKPSSVRRTGPDRTRERHRPSLRK